MERVQKLLARAGVASRRESEKLIVQGKVTINGQLAELGSQADPDTDDIRVEGRRLRFSAQRHYLAVHKPTGYISSRSDPEGRPTVMQLIPEHLRKLVYPVGRLDLDSEGLLLLMDDGDLANQLIHPRYEVPKRYQALVSGNVGDTTLAKLRKGVLLEDGLTAPAHVRVLERMEKSTALEVAIHEGRKRQVRRMLEMVGHPVQRLVRVAVGGLELGNLPAGKWRELTAAEVALLRRAVEKHSTEAAEREATAPKRTSPQRRSGPGK
jgi:pseudouridine synthase